MPHAIRRVDIAGRSVHARALFVDSLNEAHVVCLRSCRDVTHHLQLLLRKSGSNLSTSAEMETVRTIKERMCYVAINPGKEAKEILAAANNSASSAGAKASGGGDGNSGARENEFVLPDGRKIKVRRPVPSDLPPIPLLKLKLCLLVAWFGTLPRARDPVQPGAHRAGARRRTRARRRVHPARRPRPAEESFLQCRALGRDHAHERWVLRTSDRRVLAS